MQRITIAPHQLQGSILTLTSEQSHYLQRVLRLQSGDLFIIQDGQGRQWQAALEPDGRQASVVSQLEQRVRPPALELFAALPKQGFDDVVRQATELGVTYIQPVISSRTLLKPRPAKLQRWQRIAQEASEQCERGYVPCLETPIEFSHLVGKPIGPVASYICVARADVPSLLSLVQQQLVQHPQRPIRLLIGPEGGWTAEEQQTAALGGWEKSSLGAAVLRATTACVASLAVVMAAREQLR